MGGSSVLLDSHVKKSSTPPGAAIFQFPLWNNSKKANDTPDLTTLSTNKATKLDGLRQGSSTNVNNTSNIMSPPSLVKLHVESSDDSDNLAEWKNPRKPSLPQPGIKQLADIKWPCRNGRKYNQNCPIWAGNGHF